jgi:hypothetical protein
MSVFRIQLHPNCTSRFVVSPVVQFIERLQRLHGHLLINRGVVEVMVLAQFDSEPHGCGLVAQHHLRPFGGIPQIVL